MRKYVERLKPKANKLLSFVTNWQLATQEKNIELSETISYLISRGIFPAPIRSFFNLPQFQKLLSTMEKEGKLFIMPKSNEIAADETHPPLEIQNIQILVEALHRLVHLDYNRQQIKEPYVQAKVLGDNILDYLNTIETFLAFEGKVIDEILDYLFNSLRKQSERLSDVIMKNKGAFNDLLIDFVKKPIFLTLLQIDRKTYTNNLAEEWHPILIELNLDTKLSQLSTQLQSLTIANTHKLLNQMKTLIQNKRQFYQRNTPRFIPKRLKEDILQKIKIVSNGEPLTGQRVNQIFCEEFLLGKYEVIEAREVGINNKFTAYADQFWPIKKSLVALIDRFHGHQPKHFTDYFNHILFPFFDMLIIFGKPNHLAVQLVSGFFASQLDYLSDLLMCDKVNPLEVNLLEDVQNLLPIILSFLESYYAHRPKASFKTIKSLTENLFKGDETLQEYPIEMIEKKVFDLFSYLIPLEEGELHKLEDSLEKILQGISAISKKLPRNSLEALMMRSLFHEFALLDLPSFSQSWYSFGCLMSVLFTIISKQDPNFKNTIEFWISQFAKSDFFQVMLYQS